MESRWFNTVVVLFWLATMSWLVAAKVLPPLRRGEPPNYQSLYSSATPKPLPVGWELQFNGKPLGWAVSSMVKNPTGMTEVTSRIHFDRIPLAELSPAWMRLLMRAHADPVERLEMDVFGKLEIDPLGKLSRFESSMRLGGMNDAIKMTGQVGASRVKIKVESGDTVYTAEPRLPSDALISDELSPQSRIVGLRPGQEWTVPAFSPLRPPDNPIEILHASVEDREPIVWNGEAIGVHQVVYRPDSGSALSSSSKPRARLWVRDDGTVLKQEVYILGAKLVFTRMTDERSREMYESSQAQQQQELTRPRLPMPTAAVPEVSKLLPDELPPVLPAQEDSVLDEVEIPSP